MNRKCQSVSWFINPNLTNWITDTIQYYNIPLRMCMCVSSAICEKQTRWGAGHIDIDILFCWMVFAWLIGS